MAELLNILIIEDSEDDALLLVRLLERTGKQLEWQRVDEPQGLRTALSAGDWSLVLCDFAVPRLKFFDAVRLVKETDPTIPIIAVSGSIGEELTAEIMRAGVGDVVLKDRMDRLLPAIERDLAAADAVRKAALAEKALRGSEEFVRAIAANVADAIIATDEAGRIESVNVTAERSFGYSAKELIGQNVSVLMPDPHRSRHDEYLARYIGTGRSGILGVGPRELTGLRKDGSTFPLELSIAEATVNGRRIFIGAARDITLRISQENAIRESEERFRVAFETAPHGIALLGLDGLYLKVNRAKLEMLGYTEEELLGKSFQDITHADDLAASLERIGQIINGEISSYKLEKRYIRKDGEIVPALQSVSLVRSPDGSPLHFVSQTLDLTEHKETESQLIQAQKMEAVGQLTGGVAHDFNNLLTVIMGNARLMERRSQNGDAEMAASLDAIVAAARRGANLTRRLLAFSRKERLEPKVIDGRELVSGMLDMMRRTLGEAIEIRTQFASQPLCVLADPSLLESALLNLATNARDAMPEGGHLKIALTTAKRRPTQARAENGTAAEEYVVFSVSDTGTGIAAEHRDKIFDPFFTTKEVGKGSGLGLSMVFGFVKQSGGQVRMESEVGRGTTFRLFLPKVQGTSASQDALRSQEHLAANAQGTILVVEDEPGVRAVAVATLKELGYHVIESENGPDALIKLHQVRAVDLLFTDVIMPGGMTGLDLAARARERNPDLKILFTTGYASAGNSAIGHWPEDAAVLTKPYEVTELAELVGRSMGMSR